MEEGNEDYRRPKASVPKTVAFLMLATLLIVLAAFVFSQIVSDGSEDTMPRTPDSSTNQTTTPDRVKEGSGTTGDTAPSSDGTGQGGANTMLNEEVR